MYVARLSQSNLELEENAISHRDMVKQNSQQMEDVVQISGTKVLSNNTFQPHNLPKTLFSPPANEFEKHADHNVIRFHMGYKAQLGHDKATFDNRTYRKLVKKGYLHRH